MRILLLIIGCLACFACCEKNEATEQDKNPKNNPKPPQASTQGIPLTWKEATISGKSFSHAALLIPFQRKGDSFYFQVDLGAEQSAVYQGALSLVDTTANSNDNKVTSHFALKDSVFRQAFLTSSKPSSPEALTTINGKPIAGILGYDFFADLHVTIDYVNNRFYFGNPPVEVVAPGSFEPIPSRVRNKKVQFKLRDTAFWVIFDTGSSLFDMITNKAEWETLTQGTVNDTLRIPAEKSNAPQDQVLYGAAIQKNMALQNIALKGQKGYFMKGRDIPFGRLSSGASGIMGNKPFIDKAILTLNPSQNAFQMAIP